MERWFYEKVGRLVVSAAWRGYGRRLALLFGVVGVGLALAAAFALFRRLHGAHRPADLAPAAPE